VTEIWKSIDNYAGLYEVSDLGRVMRVAKYNNSKNTPLAAQTAGGYLRVGLCKEGKSRYHLVHRLVATAFIGIAPGYCVNHRNGIKSDNRLANLEVVTPKENERHKWDVLRIQHRPKQKLSFEKAAEIRLLRSQGVPFRTIAKAYGVSVGTIGFVVNGTTWVRH
jgi:hypothetical protein